MGNQPTQLVDPVYLEKLGILVEPLFDFTVIMVLIIELSRQLPLVICHYRPREKRAIRWIIQVQT
ncbi:hypothetical protein GCM10017764_29790 [Sphingobacterium griseoflavum]|uniref:Uncharacterized protein n=1 Tax=Sphingobacterium griseoflavum TaxID=1474952 RepID=A0ABQ3I030_9SPHI|nr:hypothetical protein GCM10017764_29790 [Sphingobacterium griseoflavum]